MSKELGRTLLIYNPVSQNGNGEAIAVQTIRLLRETHGFRPVVQRTSSSGHATDLAAEAHGFDTVVALGGDGLVHEVVNGLMSIPMSERPRFGLIPVGSGNDFAHTLGLSNEFHEAVRQLLACDVVTVDIGRCNGQYFAESVSFGLDAAIAIETMERRKRTGRTGTMLYLTSGIDQLRHHFDPHDYRMWIGDDAEPVEGTMYIMAVQNGPTYGGGFEICPDASPDDGELDICIASAPLNQLKAIMIFLLAKGGHHTHFRQMSFERARSLKVAFDHTVPAQIDGEVLEGTEFEIDVLPKQLDVIAGSLAREAGARGEDDRV